MAEQNSDSHKGNATPVTIFSIGHSNQSMETFLALLHQHSIEVVVDVRTSPYSKYVSHFNGAPLALALKQAGLKYTFMGKELGGRPDGEGFYDDKSHVLYGRIAKAPFFLDGLERLKEGARTYSVAILCSEEDPTVCHRHMLIGRVLAEQGVDVRHIRGDGHIQTESELDPDEEPVSYEQSLWGEQVSKQEDSTWKSIRRVSRKKQPPNSSYH